MIEKQPTELVQKIDHKSSRLLSLDALRGLIIILMALDHANHFVAQQHSPGEYWGGRFPIYHDALAFVTRLVTHLVAPGFFFLMGVGMLLFATSRQKQDWGRGGIIKHFLIRGSLLIALQLLVVNRAWELSAGGWALNIYVGVLFALGGAMIAGSLLLWLKPVYLLVLTLALILGTELLAPNPDRWNQMFHPLSRLLLVPGGDRQLWVNYPILPWVELVTFGMIFGHWLVDNPKQAFERALKLGVIFVLLFLWLRYRDGFGNIRPRAGNSWIDFLNVVKYPPSLTFTLLTMGVNLILLWLFSQLSKKWWRFFQPIIVFGQVPLFFYLAHLFLYAGIGSWLTPEGTGVPKMYPYWLLGLLILYPLCRCYGQFKHSRPPNSIVRFF